MTSNWCYTLLYFTALYYDLLYNNIIGINVCLINRLLLEPLPALPVNYKVSPNIMIISNYYLLLYTVDKYKYVFSYKHLGCVTIFVPRITVTSCIIWKMANDKKK